MDWLFLTSLGSAALVWPLALALGLVLAAERVPLARLARWWAALALASLAVAATKVLFYGWGTGVRDWNLTCFSGHATLATAFWPVALAAAGAQARWARWLGGVSGLVLAGAVAVSRVELHAHPVSEALAGVLLGLPVAVLGLRTLQERQPLRRHPVLLAGVVGAAFLAGLGRWVPYVPSEQWFQRAGVALSGRDKPVNRHRWLARTAVVPMSGQDPAARVPRIQWSARLAQP